MFKCTVCGYIHHGVEAPEKCPKCSAPKEKFIELNEEQAKLVSMSSRTNDIHMELAGILAKAEKLAVEGIDLNLDPGCVAIFKKVKEFSTQTQQSIKAEIQGHISKSKWG